MKTWTFKGLLAATAMAAVVPLALSAQAQPAGKISTYAAALTPAGIPNLEGTWTNVTMTRFERPAQFGDRKVLTDKEVSEAEGKIAATTELANAPTDPNATVHDLPVDCSGGRDDCNYNAAWTEPGSRFMRVNGEPRTSVIQSPANGRIPYTEAAKKLTVRRERTSENPESRSPEERCLESQNIRDGALMTSTLYNNNYQFVQSPDTVAIVVEMSHDARIIRLNAKHRTDGVKTWFGDSIGHYEGDTLVVETIGFNPWQLNAAQTDKLKVTERFTRTGKDAILYRFTVEDPDTYTQPWSGEYVFSPSNGPIYEYACHEGNRGLENILSGARQEEKQAQTAGTQTPASR